MEFTLTLRLPYFCINRAPDREDYDGDGNTTERINMGAYITGNENEIIGPISPALPRNLRVVQ